jgi:hypothetical protein
MPLPGVKPGSFGELFSLAIWELGLGFSPEQIESSMSELVPGSEGLAQNLAIQQAEMAATTGEMLTRGPVAPWFMRPILPTIAGIQGGYYYNVNCSFLEQDSGDMVSRQLRVSSDSLLTREEVYAKAFDAAVYYQAVTGSETFQEIDLETAKGLASIECRIESAYQGIG